MTAVIPYIMPDVNFRYIDTRRLAGSQYTSSSIDSLSYAVAPKTAKACNMLLLAKTNHYDFYRLNSLQPKSFVEFIKGTIHVSIHDRPRRKRILGGMVLNLLAELKSLGV